MKKTIKEFIAGLQKLGNDRGAMAMARRYITANDFIAACPVVEPLIPSFVTEEWKRKCFYTVAGLFAVHQEHTDEGNFGTTARHIARLNSKEATEKRFLRLITSDRDEIHDNLYAMISLAKSKGVKVNYASLLQGLIYWGDKVRHNWAISYYHAEETDTQQTVVAL